MNFSLTKLILVVSILLNIALLDIANRKSIQLTNLTIYSQAQEQLGIELLQKLEEYQYLDRLITDLGKLNDLYNSTH